MGQRRGLGVASGEPLYVLSVNACRNEVVVGTASEALCHEVWLTDCHWLLGEPSGAVEVKVRSSGEAVSGEAVSGELARGAAGLATFGLNGLALTPQFGSRQRFAGIPTTAPLKPAEKLLNQSLCDGCLECIRNCPAHALSLNPPHLCTLGGQTYRYAHCSQPACTHVARGLSTKAWKGALFNPNVDVPEQENQTRADHYDDLWSRRDARIRISEHAEATYGATLCGRCMAFCTAGHDAMNRRMRPAQTAFQSDEVLHPDGSVRVPERIARLRRQQSDNQHQEPQQS